jgi:hypothetical protein
MDAHFTALCPGGDWYAAFLLNDEPWIRWERVALFGSYETSGEIVGCVAYDDGSLGSAEEYADHFSGYFYQADVTGALKARLVAEAKADAAKRQTPPHVH